jgi:hypothetical protein
MPLGALLQVVLRGKKVLNGELGAVSAFTASEEVCSPAAIDLRRP